VDTTVTTGQLYRYQVAATNADGLFSVFSAAFDGHTMPPDAPGTLSATALSNTEIALAWSDGGPFETGYVIERCEGAACGSFASVDTVPANFVSYNDVGLSPNVTYRYQVQAINPVAASAYSNIAEKVTDLPAAPTALSALAMTGTRIDLAWTDNADNEQFYIVERCAGTCDASGTYVEIETGLAPDAEAYADNSVSAGLTYSYRVRALNVGGASPYTNIATATTAVPNDPTGLAVTTLSGTLIDLTWTDNATNELSYQVERCTSATCPTFALHKTLAADAIGYVDTVAVDDEYTYRVRAVNNVGASGYTLEETANTFRPAAPTDFAAVTVSGTRIDLTWTENATNEDGYVLERCSGVGCSDYVALLDGLPPDANGYQNDGIATETSFTYRLYAFNIAGQSAFAGPSTATTITPAAPTGLAAVLAAPGQIDLNWSDNADNELQYRVERCSAGTTKCATADSMSVYAVEVATLAPGANSHSDPGLAPATLYFYRVRATNTAGSSAYSAIVSRSTSVPPAPTGLAALTILATRIDLTWTDASANEEGFRVERCIGPDPCSSFTQIVELPAGTTSHVDSTLTEGLEVWYRVLAFNGGGGNASTVASATTIVPATPGDFVAVASGQATVNLSWVDNAVDEAGFYLERCTGLDCGDFVPLDTLAIDAMAYADLTVTPVNVYRYRLRSFGNGHSAYTPVSSAATIGPNAPTDLVATAISDTRVDLAWTDNTPTDSLWNETTFQIHRCEGESCTPDVFHAVVGPDTTVFSDSLLTPEVSYSYRVQAVNNAAPSAFTNVATAGTTVPAIPTSLTDSTVSATEVLLSWVDNAGNETGYEIERCEGNGCSDFAPVDTAAADDQSIVIDGLSGAVAYLFRIRAFNASGNSGYSNVVSAQSDVPPAPTALAGATVSPTQVNLTWTDNGENETAYIVERCDGTGCGAFVAIDSLAADVEAYQDATIAIDTAYVYRVRASNAAGASGYAAEITVSTYRPATPAALAATPISATRVDLSWTDVATNDTVIVVERCLGFGCSTFTDIDSLAPDATAYSDLTVTVNNTYNYRLRAENAAGASAPTDSVEVGTFIPSDPSGLTASTNTPTQITLDWVDNSTTENDFLIERCVGIGCSSFDSLFVVGADEVSYADTSVTLGNSYTYQVIARGGGGNSAPSGAATAHTFPAGDVSALTGSPLTATTLQLTWSAADFASLYQIDTVSGGDTTFFAFASSAVTDTIVTVPTGQVYNFVVRANNAAGSGAYAGAFVAMTPPPAPVNLQVFPLTSDQASLAWSDTSTRETSFEVERAFFSAGSFGAYTNVATLGADVTNTSNTVPVTGRYKYRVRAVNQVGAGAYSNEVDLTLSAPVAPTALSASVTAPGQITLNWTDNSDSEQSFSIERSVGNNLSFAQLATVGPGVQTHVDSSGLAINTTYYYRVRAVNSIGASGYTNEASTTTTVPSAVAAIGSAIQSSTSIQLGWNGAGTVGELGFRVYRCVGGGCTDFTLLDGSLPVDANTYTDVAASYGNFYRYQVRPYNIAGEPTGNLTADRLLALPTPGAVLALPVDRTSLRIKWNPAPFTWETGFEVEECAGFGCAGFAPLATVAADDSMDISAGLPADGAWHRYRVRAVADGNVGPWSTIATTHTPKEVTLGDTLVSVTGAEMGAAENMTHYVVAMPAGSPTVEVSIGDDPGGTTTTGGSYIILSRGQGIQRHANLIATLGTFGDTLCSPPVFVQAGNSGGCSLPHLGVTTDYYITTYSNVYTNLQLTALPGPTTYTFNNCTQTGRVGPAQGQCDAAYTSTSLEGLVAVADSGFQDWTVPFSGRWAVTAVGAAGASATPGFNGGRGARIYGEFVLTAGQDLRVAVGQLGSGVSSGGNGGGGGGSFVYDLTGGTPMVIAGGGGGTRGGALQNGCDASTTAFAVVGSGGTSSSPCTLKVSGAGEGGAVSSVSWGSAGAGFNSNGADDFGAALTGGRSWANFIVGGKDAGCGIGDGGFGGAGSGYGCNGGGGGGGYSGGDGGWIAGGGGSFNAGTSISVTVGVGTGHGTITLRYLGPN
jgi:titin